MAAFKKCKDCSHAEMCKWIDELEGRGCDFGEPCEDAISREAVKEIINDIRDCISVEGYCAILERLKKLPSVTPSRPIGHWIETEYHRWRCSVCREKGISEWDNIHDVRTNFCPDCGADMRGAE